MTRTIITAQPGFTLSGVLIVAWAVDDDTMEAVPVVVDDSFVGRLAWDPGSVARMVLEPQEPSTPAPKPSPTTAQAPGAVGPYRIPFGGKTYKLVSFWQFDGDEGRFIFQMPPETPTPSDSRCQKVNRDEFAKLKKDGVAILDFDKVRGDGEPGSANVPDAEEAEQAPPVTSDPEDDFI